MPCASSPILPFQHTAARRRLHPGDSNSYYRVMVSTHSRAEAVALFDRTFHESQQCFNTQPPKGGCYTNFPSIPPPFFVSTHSHPKAAATMPCASSPILPFQHTAARRRLLHEDFEGKDYSAVSTHSRTKAAASRLVLLPCMGMRFQHTAARRRLPSIRIVTSPSAVFQHTAARRRLHGRRQNSHNPSSSFNTQPRGGGCGHRAWKSTALTSFQHTAARRRLHFSITAGGANLDVSTHSRAEAAAITNCNPLYFFWVSTHSRAEAAARIDVALCKVADVSTHSRAEAAAPK